MKLNRSNYLNRESVVGGMALLATTISLSLSVSVGWQLGESLHEKLMMAAFGVLAVLGAHLLLTLCRPASLVVRMAAAGLWLFCIVYVTYSHASYFLSAQNKAGMHRADAIGQPSSKSEPVRNLSAVLAEQAKIKTELVAKSQLGCRDSCARLQVQLTSLKARLAALDAEADEVRKWDAQHDRYETRKEALRHDPVTMRLAKWLGVTAVQVGLVMGFLFSFILEGIACLCWYVAFRSRDSIITEPVGQAVTATPDVTQSSNEKEKQLLFESESKIDELVREVMAGRLRLTVNDVRKHCRCAQKKAAELKLLVEKRLVAAAQGESSTAIKKVT